MKRVFQFLIMVVILFWGQKVFPQTVYDVTVSNFTFNPSQLKINVGDIVRWTNAGGMHSVVADDSSFISGPISSSAWVFEHTFNSVGTNPYYCAQHGGPGGLGMSGVITVENATDVKDNDFSIYQFELQQNYPNPFNPGTNIQYTISTKQIVSLKVFDVLGNEVATLVNEEKPAGSYEITFNASSASGGLSSGIYFYKLQAGSFVETKKMILLR